MNEYINNQFKEVSAILNEMPKLTDTLIKASKLCVDALNNGNKLIWCGNGISASQSDHFSTSLVTKFKLNRKHLNSVSLTCNGSNLTAIGNDYGFNEIFSVQLDAIGNKGDVLIGLSTSGNSKNVLSAFNMAKTKEISTIAFAGKDGGEMSKIADYSLIVPSKVGSHIQESHIILGHLLCDLIEKEMFENN